jgi:hypothetical protein
VVMLLLLLLLLLPWLSTPHVDASASRPASTTFRIHYACQQTGVPAGWVPAWLSLGSAWLSSPRASLSKMGSLPLGFRRGSALVQLGSAVQPGSAFLAKKLGSALVKHWFSSDAPRGEFSPPDTPVWLVWRNTSQSDQTRKYCLHTGKPKPNIPFPPTTRRPARAGRFPGGSRLLMTIFKAVGTGAHAKLTWPSWVSLERRQVVPVHLVPPWVPSLPFLTHGS